MRLLPHLTGANNFSDIELNLNVSLPRAKYRQSLIRSTCQPYDCTFQYNQTQPTPGPHGGTVWCLLCEVWEPCYKEARPEHAFNNFRLLTMDRLIEWDVLRQVMARASTADVSGVKNKQHWDGDILILIYLTLNATHGLFGLPAWEELTRNHSTKIPGKPGQYHGFDHNCV